MYNTIIGIIKFVRGVNKLKHLSLLNAREYLNSNLEFCLLFSKFDASLTDVGPLPSVISTLF